MPSPRRARLLKMGTPHRTTRKTPTTTTELHSTGSGLTNPGVRPGPPVRGVDFSHGRPGVAITSFSRSTIGDHNVPQDHEPSQPTAAGHSGIPSLCCPQALATPQTAAITTHQLFPQTQQDEFTRGFRDGYRQGHDDGETDGRLDCQKPKVNPHVEPGQPTDYQRGFSAGYPQGYESGHARICGGS
jgi:hypothetical protein